MSWDALADEINAEFASVAALDPTEESLWRRYQARAERLHAKTQRGAGGVPAARTCDWCAKPLPVSGKRGPVAKCCSNVCRAMLSRARRVASLGPVVHGTTEGPPAEPPAPRWANRE